MAGSTTMPKLNLLRDSGGGASEHSTATRAPNSVVGVAILIAAEMIFFGGLITAFLVLRASAIFWPPPDQPRLPALITAINTVILLASGLTMRMAVIGVQRGESIAFVRRIGITALLGSIFLLVQGIEWLRLIAHGLRVAQGVYGGLFTTIISVHGLHVFGGLVALMIVTMRARQGRCTLAAIGSVEACALYWMFVVAVWPVLYVLVYLS